jgi:hypothetical protein
MDGTSLPQIAVTRSWLRDEALDSDQPESIPDTKHRAARSSEPSGGLTRFNAGMVALKQRIVGRRRKQVPVPRRQLRQPEAVEC